MGAEGGGSAEVVAMAKVSYNTFAQVIHVLKRFPYLTLPVVSWIG